MIDDEPPLPSPSENRLGVTDVDVSKALSIWIIPAPCLNVDSSAAGTPVKPIGRAVFCRAVLIVSAVALGNRVPPGELLVRPRGVDVQYLGTAI